MVELAPPEELLENHRMVIRSLRSLINIGLACDGGGLRELVRDMIAHQRIVRQLEKEIELGGKSADRNGTTT